MCGGISYVKPCKDCIDCECLEDYTTSDVTTKYKYHCNPGALNFQRKVIKATNQRDLVSNASNRKCQVLESLYA